MVAAGFISQKMAGYYKYGQEANDGFCLLNEKGNIWASMLVAI